MATVVSKITGQSHDIEEWNLRVDLATAFRLAVYFNRVSIDMGFEGMANNSDEGLRIANVIGEAVADAFENLYFLERAAKTLMRAYSTGQPLNIIPDEIAENVAQEEPFIKGLAKGHFEYLKSMLDEQDASYRE